VPGERGISNKKGVGVFKTHYWYVVDKFNRNDKGVCLSICKFVEKRI